MKYTVGQDGSLVGENGEIIPKDQVDSDDFNVVGNELDQYGTPGQQALTAVEGALRGVSLGLSDVVEQKVLAPLNPDLFGPKAVRKREEANPWSHTLPNMVGTGALLVGTAGLGPAALVAEEGASLGLAARATRWGLEGAALGAGEAVTENALGDPELNAEKIASMVAVGGAFGAGLGGLSYALEAALPFLRKGKNVPRGTKAIEAFEGATKPAEEPVAWIDKSFKTIEEQDKALREGRKDPKQAHLFEMPQKTASDAAVAHVNPLMKYPFDKVQEAVYSNQESLMRFKQMLDEPGYGGKVYKEKMMVQNNELKDIIQNSIQNIAPGHTLADDMLKAGQNAARLLDEVTQKTRNELIPELKNIKNVGEPKNHYYGVIEAMTDHPENPFALEPLAQAITYKDGEIVLKAYEDTMSLEPKTYSNVKKALNNLKKEPTSIKQLFAIRDDLLTGVNKLTDSKDAQQLTQLRAAMLDYIQKEVVESVPNARVREIMRKYAENESNIDYLQMVIGADIDLRDWRRISQNKEAEKVLKNIFHDSIATTIVKNVVGEENFATITADYLHNLMLQNTKNNLLSHQNMGNALKNQSITLNEAFKTRGNDQYENIKQALTAMQLFPATMTGNPSGSATTAFRALKANKLYQKAMEFGEEWVFGKYNNYKLNKQLEGITEKAVNLEKISKIVNKADKEIISKSKEVFVKTARIGAQQMMSRALFDDAQEKIGTLTNNPDALVDYMAENTAGLYNAAPQISQAMQINVMNALQFLKAKLPQSKSEMPLSPKFEPTPQERSKFSRYYHAVNDPISVLGQVKSGSLTNESMEALKAVHPKLLNFMRQVMLDNWKQADVSRLPYGQKLAIAKFLEVPLDENMTSLGIAANQMAIAAPQQADQIPAGMQKTSQRGLEKLNGAKRSETRTSGSED